MTEFNRFQGLQSRIKPLSIYTVVLLYSRSRLITAVAAGRTVNTLGID
jgi:hypothetical protein